MKYHPNIFLRKTSEAEWLLTLLLPSRMNLLQVYLHFFAPSQTFLLESDSKIFRRPLLNNPCNAFGPELAESVFAIGSNLSVHIHV
jgi:hypothetical protein